MGESFGPWKMGFDEEMMQYISSANVAGGFHDGIVYQLGALREFARYYDMEVQHVKPHGALYMVAARDEELSRAIIEAIQRVDPGLLLFCMQASVTYQLAQKLDQPVVAEFYADREYNNDGQIVFTRSVAEELDPEEVGDR